MARPSENGNHLSSSSAPDELPSGVRKVTLGLREEDIRNAEVVKELARATSNAHAVSIALSLGRFVLEVLNSKKDQLLIRNEKGELERVRVPHLEFQNHAP
jgi:hypothetical protein